MTSADGASRSAIKSDIGNFGGSIAFLNGKDGNSSNDSEVQSSQFEGALHWRLQSNGWLAHARVSGAPISMKGTRSFRAEAGAEDIDKTMRGKWDATLYSASGSIAKDARVGGLTLRSTVAVDYYKLKEDGYTETGGGDALDLTVESRDSDELAVTGSVAVGLEFGGTDQYIGWTRFELEGGRRQIVSGNLGATTASFKTARPSPWFLRIARAAGSRLLPRHRRQLGLPGRRRSIREEQQSHIGWAARASLRIGL